MVPALRDGTSMRRIIILVPSIAAGMIACGSSSRNSKPLDAAVDADDSSCGHPGDMGNELGVGQYCNTLTDCGSNAGALLCATLGNPQAHFCTKTCVGSGSAGQCGTNATCECQGGQCGCTPN